MVQGYPLWFLEALGSLHACFVHLSNPLRQTLIIERKF